MGYAVAQLVEALRQKPEDCGFDSRWCHWFRFIELILPAALGLSQFLTKMNTRNLSWGVKAAGAYGWQPYHLHVPICLYILGVSMCCTHEGLSRPALGEPLCRRRRHVGRFLAGIVGSSSSGGMDDCFLGVMCVVADLGLCDWPITRAGESHWVCVCVSLCVITWHSNPLHLQWLGRKRLD